MPFWKVDDLRTSFNPLSGLDKGQSQDEDGEAGTSPGSQFLATQLLWCSNQIG